MDLRRELDERLVGLVWSLWAELGVSGWERRHDDVAVDLEPLILFTAGLAERDPRLRDESTDWCVRHGSLISKVRLKNLRAHGLADPMAFAEYAATVNRYGRLSWPADDAAPRRFTPTGRSTLDLARPALLQLRSRAIFGVSARAELLALFAAEPRRERTVTALAERIHYGRRNTVEALDMLHVAGLVVGVSEQRARTYVTLRADALRGLLGPLPGSIPSWTPRFRVFAALRELAERFAGAKDAVRVIEAQKTLDASANDVLAGDLPQPPRLSFGDAAWPAFGAWVMAAVAAAYTDAERAAAHR